VVAGHAKQDVKKALVVGGQGSFVKEKLSKSLSRHGVAISMHLSWDKRRPPSKLPKDIDLVYICTDMVGHGLSVPCMQYARDLGIPYVNGTRKWAESLERLTQAGFPLIDPATALPEIIDEVVSSRPPGTKPTGADLRAVAIAYMGDVAKADAMLDPVYNETTGMVDVKTIPSMKPASTVISASLPSLPAAPTPEPLKDITMATIPDNRKDALGVHNPKQHAYLTALIQDPCWMNKELWETLQSLPLFAGCKLDPQRAATAREQLGIKVTRSNGMRYIDIELEKFLETAETIKVKYTLPEAHYEQSDTAMTPMKAAPAPAASPVSAPNRSVLELLAELRYAMKAENYTEIHVTEGGIDYKRVVVETGKLAF